MKRIEALTEILPYVREFQGKTFVVKLGGELCQGEVLSNIAQQLSLVHHIGIKLVLVHGGGPQLDEVSKSLGITPVKKAGRRVTDDKSLAAAKMVFCGSIGTDVAAALCSNGMKALGLSGVDGSLITAVKRPPLRISNPDGSTELVDFLNVGIIESVNSSLLQDFLGLGLTPLISPIAASPEGATFNINADTLAAKVAVSLKAEKLILMSNVPGILKAPPDPSSLISYLDIEGVQSLIEEGTISSGMLPKVQACIDALKSGVSRTHIIDGTRQGSLLLELFLNEGVGTMIVERSQKN
jgi:acetylglutamate kinase